MRPAALLLLSTLLCGSAFGQSVSMSGRLGDNKALLMIDGQPRTLAVGATTQGVKLLSLTADGAVVEIGGQRNTLRIGESQVRFSRDSQGPTRIVLMASEGGHFVGNAIINGQPVKFMVDTGATSVAISSSLADRLGLKYRDGKVGMASTANGTVMMYIINLDRIRVGDVQVHDVQAAVVQADMPYVLLGNSYLTRFQMKREDNVMTLEKRP